MSEPPHYDPEQHFRYILGSERGSLSYGSGIARVKTRLSMAGPDWPSPDDLTLMHEMVHQIHMLTTPFLFRYCEDYRHLVSEFGRWLAADLRPDEVIGELRQTLDEMDHDLNYEWGADPTDGIGISARQLIEGVASVEPLRPMVTSEGAITVLKRLKAWVHGDSTYLRAIGALCRVIGPGDGIRLFSTLAFAALHYEHPGEAFVGMLWKLNEHPSRARQMTLPDVIDAFIPSDYTSLILRFANDEVVSRGRSWNIAGRMFAKSGPIEMVHLAAANPSSMLFGTDVGSALEENAGVAVLPFLTISEYGVFKTGGPLRGLPDAELRDAVLNLITLDELSGVMTRLGQPDNEEIRNACIHLDCPEHTGHLCSLAIPPPNTGKWEDCAFRERFRGLAGVSLGDFAARYGLVIPAT